MSLKLGNGIAVSTNFIKSNPAVPVYNGEECPDNLYAVIYHIEIGYNEGKEQKVKQLTIKTLIYLQTRKMNYSK